MAGRRTAFISHTIPALQLPVSKANKAERLALLPQKHQLCCFVDPPPHPRPPGFPSLKDKQKTTVILKKWQISVPLHKGMRAKPKAATSVSEIDIKTKHFHGLPAFSLCYSTFWPLKAAILKFISLSLSLHWSHSHSLARVSYFI